MDVTLLICTWNRAECLQRCLGSLTKIIVPKKIKWEVLVVNNGSTDDTLTVLSLFKNRLPLTSVTEPDLGLSNARNRGVRNSKGDLIIFFDDDVVVDPLCLLSFCDAVSKFSEGALYGGLIEPHLSLPLKTTLLLKDAFFDGLILRKNLGKTLRVMDSNEYFFGANFAVKRKVFDEIGFDVNLGKKGNRQLVGEEIRLQDEAMGRGWQRIWVPEAKVNHLITPKRLSLASSGRYFWGLGRTHHKLTKTVLFPRLETLTFFGTWTQINFLAGCLFESLSSSLKWREPCT